MRKSKLPKVTVVILLIAAVILWFALDFFQDDDTEDYGGDNIIDVSAGDLEDKGNTENSLASDGAVSAESSGKASDNAAVNEENAVMPKDDSNGVNDAGSTGNTGGTGNAGQESAAYGNENMNVITPAKGDFLVLVNKKNSVPSNYIPEDMIVPNSKLPNRSANTQCMVREAAEAFNLMTEAAATEGHELLIITAYRSYEFQRSIYNGYVEKDGQAAADRYSARPGTSEHQIGLAADVTSPSVDYGLKQSYGDTAEGKWLAENCHKFGFIIRYMADKEDITGYMYEPWHVRYVGIDAATYIYMNNLCLEEYIEMLQPPV